MKKRSGVFKDIEKHLIWSNGLEAVGGSKSKTPGKNILTKADLKNYMAIPPHVIARPDSSKTPNDFGFQKLCFPLEFLKHSITNTGIEAKLEESKKTESSSDSFIEQFRGNKDSEGTDQNSEKSDSIDSKVKTEENARDQVEKLVAQVKDIEKATKDTKLNSYSTWQSVYSSNSPLSNVYAQHTSKYMEYMNSYINSNENNASSQSYSQTGEGKPMKQGDEVMDFQERKEYAKKVMMNARYGNSTMPHSSQGEKQKYEMWKASSKFNQLLSFAMYDSLKMMQ